MKGRVLAITTAAAVLLAANLASAKTIVITEAECELMALISAEAPRMSWAAIPLAAAEFGNHSLNLTVKSSFLIKYPLEKIPKGQRITKAEWVVPYSLTYPPTGAKLEVRRILQDWGAGVSHQARMTRPKKLPWHTPGALGVGQDRAVKPTSSATLKGSGEQVFNVTEDVELWYSGAVQNFGWQLSTEDPMASAIMHSPFWTGAKLWKLRITYEPE